MLIYFYGWNNIEQWTWVGGGAFLILQSIIAIVVFRRTFIGDGLENYKQKEFNQQYAQQGYLAEKHARLQRELHELEAEFNRL